MDSASQYLSMSEPDKSNHLWKYTPWRRVHPTGKITEIPELASATLSLSMMDGTEVPSGVSLVRGNGEDLDLSMDNALTNSFLHAMSNSSNWLLIVESGFRFESPIILDVQTGEVDSVAHISMEIGEMADFELVTRVSGKSDWFGLLRTGNIGSGTILNDVLIGLQEKGTFLRSDSLKIGRDAQLRAGTVSSGSERTKSDLRYKLEERGGGIKVLGSILSAESMHLDHHIEIHHEAPDTFSRLSWHSACGGDSRTIGTGMLQVSKGAKGADAGQIFHNLLLSDSAEADSVPELEVMENDVVGCGHGTANGPIDEEQVFYLKTRGFDGKEAKRALIAAFLNSTLSEMGGEGLHEWLVGELTLQLEALHS